MRILYAVVEPERGFEPETLLSSFAAVERLGSKSEYRQQGLSHRDYQNRAKNGA
jgi:hypothetical protein